jgi:hypothetical protein
VFSLLCAAVHPCIPGLTPGVSIGLDRSLGGGLSLQIPMTAKVSGMILAAIRDGALVPDGPRDEFWDEMETAIMATRDELLARADHLLLNAPVAQLHAS